MEVSWMRITAGDEFITGMFVTWTAITTAEPTGDGDVTFKARCTNYPGEMTFVRDPRDTVWRAYSKQYDMFNV